jgi:alpha-D-ribose 1-methylphosphonate 5-triphosphate diphosphatase
MISIRATRILTADSPARAGWVSIDHGVITDVTDRPPAGAELRDYGDVDVLPGLIDLHADTLAEKSFPRPSSEYPLPAALAEFDLDAAAHGITCPFLCVALEEEASKHRSVARAEHIVTAVAATRPTLLTDLRIHLRVDVTGTQTGPTAARLAQAHPALIRMISYMDHTPGQGQYPDESTWRASYAASDHATTDELDRRLAAKRAGAAHAAEVRAQLAATAHQTGAILASHDDDSAETIARATDLGVTICEFPVTLAAARAARTRGMGIVMGAPNARRGSSHLTNLSAREALTAGCLDILVCDYHPPSLLAAAYALARDGLCTWAQAITLVTANPARLVGLTDRGQITPGTGADLIVARARPHPEVLSTWVAGTEVFRRATRDASPGAATVGASR